ncbi:ATP-binding cassette domain-containing protein [Microbacterium resistens]|uniref:ATP-binding cassette domain-containing protein n=1 Tax=Microbacterium resistens TaxID=156977 RepID=A0ABY3RSP6_9MICO|nr:ATP-binding cassette domain-containing protein [Microbacterium resistens]UGS25985.1 ATP-binding cassette domain-containing protein [Microbacterium resistens]
MTDGQLLEFSRVTKRFGALTAVDDLSAQIAPGTVTGFLGPNGAGKTTSLRILLGQVRATSGTATIGGKAYSELRHPLRTVGAVMEDTAYRPRRTATRQLTIAAKANGIPLSRVAEVLALVGLQNETETRIGAYSLGMRQRLSVAHALLGDPGALVLDEPANGLDPEGIRWMRLLIRRLADEGRTVLVSSHVLSEIEQIADDVLVLSKGRLVYADSMSKLSDPTTGSVVVDAEDRDALAAALSASGLSHDVLRSGLTVHDTDAATVGAVAASAGLALTTLQQRGPTLEEVFLDLVHGRRDPVAGGTRASAAAAAAGSSATGAPDDAPEAAPAGEADATTALPVVGDAESPVSAGAAIGAGAAVAGAVVAGGLRGTEGGSEPSTRRAARTQAEDADAGDEPADADADASAAEGETPDETFAAPLAEGEAPASDGETTGDSASDESKDAADEPGDVVADESTDDETAASPEDAEPSAPGGAENDVAEETAADASTAEGDASASDTAEDSAVAAGVALTAPIDTDTDFGVTATSADDGADITTPSEQDDDRTVGPLPFATAAISVPDAAPEPTFDELISGVPASAQDDAASADEAPTTALPVPAESSEADGPAAEDAPEAEVDAPADAGADAPDDAEERATEEDGADGRAAAEADAAEDAPEAPSEDEEETSRDEASAEDETSAEEPPTETSGITGIEIFSSLTEGQTQAIPVVLDASHGSEPEDADDVTKDEDPRAAAVSASLAAAARAYYSEDAPSYTPGDAEPDEERRTWRIASTGVIDTVPTAEEGEHPSDADDAPATGEASGAGAGAGEAESSEEQHSDATPDDAADAQDGGEGEGSHDGSEDGERPRD